MMILVFVVQFIFADGGKKDGDKTDSVPLIPTIDISVENKSNFCCYDGR